MSEQILGFVAFGALLAIAVMGYVISSSSANRLHGGDGIEARDAPLRN